MEWHWIVIFGFAIFIAAWFIIDCQNDDKEELKELIKALEEKLEIIREDLENIEERLENLDDDFTINQDDFYNLLEVLELEIREYPEERTIEFIGKISEPKKKGK
jgi:predicted  nucleic acid-binding Zn-ribbon protein